MTKEKDDKVIRDYLKGDSKVSRLYHAGTFRQPSKQLDDAILAASRKAVGSKPRRYGLLFKSNWYKSMSWAAVVVLCVSLVFNIYKDTDQALLTAPGSPVDFDQTSPGLMRDDIPVIPRSKPADKSEMLDELIYETDDTKMQGERKSGTLNLQSEIAPANTPLESITPLTEKGSGGKNIADPDDSNMIWQQKNKDASEEIAIQPEPIGEMNGHRALEKSNGLQDEYPEALNARQFEPLTQEMQIIQEDMQESPARILNQESEKSTKSDPVFQDQEQWLDHINMLWENGNEAEADKRLKEFLKTYPDYPLATLKEKLHDEIDLSGYIR